MSPEYLDIVDQTDTIIGRDLRTALVGSERFHRIVSIFIKNSDGKLWIPRRTEHKSMFPSCLDMSAGGYVQSGESYDQAFARETEEELGIDVTHVPHTFLGTLPPSPSLPFFDATYEIQSNDVPQYNRDDFCEYFWLTPQELLTTIEQGEGHKTILPQLVKKFYT